MAGAGNGGETVADGAGEMTGEEEDDVEDVEGADTAAADDGGC